MFCPDCYLLDIKMHSLLFLPHLLYLNYTFAQNLFVCGTGEIHPSPENEAIGLQVKLQDKVQMQPTQLRQMTTMDLESQLFSKDKATFGIYNDISPTFAPDKRAPSKEKRTPVEGMSVQTKSNIKPFGRCKKTAHDRIACLVSRSLCSNRMSICPRPGPVCQCDWDPRDYLPQVKGDRPTGKCLTKHGRLQCCVEGRKCSNLTSICVKSQVPCQCDYNPFQSQIEPSVHQPAEMEKAAKQQTSVQTKQPSSLKRKAIELQAPDGIIRTQLLHYMSEEELKEQKRVYRNAS